MSDREQLLLSLQQRKVFSFDPIMTLIWPQLTFSDQFIDIYTERIYHLLDILVNIW